MPKVSVIIPTRNRRTTVERAVQSVLNQTFRDFELIVVNDGSTDDTARFLSSLDFPSLVCVNLDSNQGGGNARNQGIKHSSGDFLAFLDDDDTWEPVKLAEQIESLETKSPVLCYTGKRIFNSQGKFLKYTYKKPRFSDPYKSIMGDNFIGSTSSVMVPKRIAESINGFDPDFPALQDWDFYIRLIKNGAVPIGIDKPLVNYYWMDKTKNVSLNAQNHLFAARRMKEKYTDDPCFDLLKKALFAVTVKKSFKSWGFLKGLAGWKRR